MNSNSNLRDRAPEKPATIIPVVLTPKEAAQRLRLSSSWLAKARMRGDGPPYIQIGRAIRSSIGRSREDSTTRPSPSTFSRLMASRITRKQADYFSIIPEMKLPAEMVKLAQHIIETKSAAFDPAMLEDHYRNALVRILRKKQAKMPAPPAPVAPSRENVINLMDALRRSITAEPPAKRPAAASKAARAKRRSPARHR